MSNIGGGFMTNNNGGGFGGYSGGGYGGGNFGGGNFGGGYDNNQGSANKNGTSPFKGDRNQQQKKGSIIPLTIKKLVEASNRPDDVVEVDGNPVDQAVIVGRVYKVEDQSTRTILHLDDSTGRIQVAYYKKGDGSGNGGIDNFYYKENMYVKVVVVVRPFKTQKMFVSNLLQPVEDFNQVSYHLLSTFLASAYRNKGPLEKPDPNVQDKQNQPSSQNFNMNQSGSRQSGVGLGMNSGMNSGMGMGSNYQPMQMSNMATNDPQTIIKNTINQLQNQSTNGVCKQSRLQQILRGKIAPQTILNCLQQLESNAEIYRDEDQQDPGFMLLGN